MTSTFSREETIILLLYTIKEVAAKLKISLSMAYALISRGELACYRIGTCKRVSEEQLKEYLELARNSVFKMPQPKGRHF